MSQFMLTLINLNWWSFNSLSNHYDIYCWNISNHQLHWLVLNQMKQCSKIETVLGCCDATLKRCCSCCCCCFCCCCCCPSLKSDPILAATPVNAVSSSAANGSACKSNRIESQLIGNETPWLEPNLRASPHGKCRCRCCCRYCCCCWNQEQGMKRRVEREGKRETVITKEHSEVSCVREKFRPSHLWGF